MRRIETVTISAPLASRQSSSTCWFGYPAVPTKSRDFNVVPAITSGSVMGRSPGRFASAPLERTDDFDSVASRKLSGEPFRAAHDCSVYGDGEKACCRVDTAGDQQFGNGCRRNFFLDTVDAHQRHRTSTPPSRSDLSTTPLREPRKRSAANGAALCGIRPGKT